MSKRVAIVGTAPSWSQTPWDDPTLEVWSLNDAYMCADAKGRGIPRANRWYELHPLDKLWFRPKHKRTVYAHEIPVGHYVRPEGHLEWLQQQATTIPVFLQGEPPAGWPSNAQRFPIEAMVDRFGEYWSSGPSYMVAQAIVEGYEEIAIYGIHLSTQSEYIEQRPNFEHLLGIARGMGIKVHMAEQSPLMKHGWRYGYEPKPTPEVPASLAEARQEIKTVREEKAKLADALIRWPRWKSKQDALDRLEWLALVESDLAQTISRHHTAAATIQLQPVGG